MRLKSVVITTLLLWVIAGCGPAAPPAPPAKTYALGEAISNEKYEIKVIKIETRSKVGGEYFEEKASEGATIVGVQFSVKNVGTKPMGMFEQPSVKLIDAAGVEYSSDVAKSSSYSTEVNPDSKVMSDLNPGITVKSATAFEVSKELFNRDTWKIRTSDGAEVSLAAVSGK